MAGRPADVTAGGAGCSMTVPGAACTVAGEIGIEAQRLPWAAAQIGRWLDRELAAGRLADDRGRCPADVAARARSYLDAAVRHAAALDVALASAQADLDSLRHQASPSREAVT